MFESNKLRTAEMRGLSQPAEPLVQYRVTVLDRETYQMPASVRKIRVLSGTVRVLLSDHELIVHEGEQKSLVTRQETKVVPASNGLPVVLEMGLSAASPEQKLMKRQFYERLALRQQIIEVEDRHR